jgi:hypothetical protein
VPIDSAEHRTGLTARGIAPCFEHPQRQSSAARPTEIATLLSCPSGPVFECRSFLRKNGCAASSARPAQIAGTLRRSRGGAAPGQRLYCLPKIVEQQRLLQMWGGTWCSTDPGHQPPDHGACRQVIRIQRVCALKQRRQPAGNLRHSMRPREFRQVQDQRFGRTHGALPCPALRTSNESGACRPGRRERYSNPPLVTQYRDGPLDRYARQTSTDQSPEVVRRLAALAAPSWNGPQWIVGRGRPPAGFSPARVTDGVGPRSYFYSTARRSSPLPGGFLRGPTLHLCKSPRGSAPRKPQKSARLAQPAGRRLFVLGRFRPFVLSSFVCLTTHTFGSKLFKRQD